MVFPNTDSLEVRRETNIGRIPDVDQFDALYLAQDPSADNPFVTTAQANVIVNVKSFGAKGDCVYNGATWSGTDDTVAIQSASDFAYLHGYALHFPPGFYGVSYNMYIRKGLIVYGAGRAISVLVMLRYWNTINPPGTIVGDTPSIFNLKSPLIVHGNEALTNPNAWVRDVTIRDLGFYGFRSGFATKAITSMGSRDVEIYNCAFTDLPGEVIWPSVDPLVHYYWNIHHNRVEHTNPIGITYPAAGASIQGNLSFSKIHHNVVINPFVGIGGSGYDLDIYDNTVIDYTVAGIGNGDGVQTGSRVIIARNRLSTHGVTTATTAAIGLDNICRDCQVIDNVIKITHLSVNSGLPAIGINTAAPGSHRIADNTVIFDMGGFARPITGIQAGPDGSGTDYKILNNVISVANESTAANRNGISFVSAAGTTQVLECLGNRTIGMTTGNTGGDGFSLFIQETNTSTLKVTARHGGTGGYSRMLSAANEYVWTYDIAAEVDSGNVDTTNTLRGRTQQQRIEKVVDFASTVTLDCFLSEQFSIRNLAGNVTANIINPRVGHQVSVVVVQDGTGTRTFAFNAVSGWTIKSDSSKLSGGDLAAATGSAAQTKYTLDFYEAQGVKCIEIQKSKPA